MVSSRRIMPLYTCIHGGLRRNSDQRRRQYRPCLSVSGTWWGCMFSIVCRLSSPDRRTWFAHLAGWKQNTRKTSYTTLAIAPRGNYVPLGYRIGVIGVDSLPGHPVAERVESACMSRRGSTITSDGRRLWQAASHVDVHIQNLCGPRGRLAWTLPVMPRSSCHADGTRPRRNFYCIQDLDCFSSPKQRRAALRHGTCTISPVQ